MNQELQEKLYKSFPKIFRQKDLSMKHTAMCWGISCGDGWYNIIHALCMHLQHLVDNPNEQIEMYNGWISDEEKKEVPRKDWINKCNSFIENEKEKIIPQLEAVQVKEKFGVLRFYLSGYPDNDIMSAKIRSYISFAESMSAKTCEICGSPGKVNEGAWITVRCNNCK